MAGGQTEQVIFAALVGEDGVSSHGCLVLRLDLGLRNRKTGGILNRAEKLGAARLSETEDRDGDEAEKKNEEPLNLPKHKCVT